MGYTITKHKNYRGDTIWKIRFSLGHMDGRTGSGYTRKELIEWATKLGYRGRA